jgi:hypothetical protein
MFHLLGKDNLFGFLTSLPPSKRSISVSRSVSDSNTSGRSRAAGRAFKSDPYYPNTHPSWIDEHAQPDDSWRAQPAEASFIVSRAHSSSSMPAASLCRNSTLPSAALPNMHDTTTPAACGAAVPEHIINRSLPYPSLCT